MLIRLTATTRKSVGAVWERKGILASQEKRL